MSAAPSIDIIRTTTALRSRIGDWRRDGLRVGLVPTMGALHTGHFSLVKRSIESTDRTCVTLFVNPKQFGPAKIWNSIRGMKKPMRRRWQSEGAHLPLCGRALTKCIPTAFRHWCRWPALAISWKAGFRPGFFEGVATVVTKLLLQALPDAAFFGEKDFQQLCVVRRAVADLSLPVEIVGCPTVREADGLAISSRNAYALERGGSSSRARPSLKSWANSETVYGGVRRSATPRHGRSGRYSPAASLRWTTCPSTMWRVSSPPATPVRNPVFLPPHGLAAQG